MSPQQHLRLAVASTLTFSAIVYIVAPKVGLAETVPTCFMVGSTYNIVNVLFFYFVFGSFISETRRGFSPHMSLVTLVTALKLPLLFALLWWLSGFGQDCALSGVIGILLFLPVVVLFDVILLRRRESLGESKEEKPEQT